MPCRRYEDGQDGLSVYRPRAKNERHEMPQENGFGPARDAKDTRVANPPLPALDRPPSAHPGQGNSVGTFGISLAEYPKLCPYRHIRSTIRPRGTSVRADAAQAAYRRIVTADNSPEVAAREYVEERHERDQGKHRPRHLRQGADIAASRQVDPDQDHGDRMQEADQELKNLLHVFRIYRGAATAAATSGPGGTGEEKIIRLAAGGIRQCVS
jgi:hypothetical protein